MAGLRDRNRRAALEHVQTVAMGLFAERGYEQVTVAEIAAAAEVSESTFYRLFRTKEGLFTAVPWSGALRLRGTTVAELCDEVRSIVADTDTQWLGLRWAVEQPDVRRAVLESLDALAELGAAHLRQHGHEDLEAAAQAHLVLFGVYWAALEQWYRDGRPGPFLDYFDRARAVFALS